MRFISNIYSSLIGDSHGPRAQASCSQRTCNRKEKLNLFSSSVQVKSNGYTTGSLSEAHLQRAFSDLAKKKTVAISVHVQQLTCVSCKILLTSTRRGTSDQL